jgi:hypothetical protein
VIEEVNTRGGRKGAPSEEERRSLKKSLKGGGMKELAFGLFVRNANQLPH